MRFLRASFLIPFFLFLLAVASAVLLQKENIARWRKLPFEFRDTLYLPSSEYVKVVSLGYDQFTADFLWLRMIQCFAGAWSSQENVDQMKSYCDIITDLDPKFTDVYNFAVMAIGEQGKSTASFSKDPQALKRIDPLVIGIIDKAIRKYPNNYSVPYQGAFYAFWGMNDPQLAKYYVKMAKKDPNYPDYIDRWEAYFDMKQGRYRAAYEKFMTDFIHAVQSRNKDLYPILHVQLSRAVNAWFVDEVRQKALEWKKTHPDYPSYEDLERAGAFRGVSLPNWALISAFMEKLLSGGISDNIGEESLNRFIQGAIQKVDYLPPAPYDMIAPEYPRFVVWKTCSPDSKTFVLSKLEAMREMKKTALMAMDQAKEYKKTKGVYPPDLIAIDPVFKHLKDPFGGNWTYDRMNGSVGSQTYPDITKLAIPDIY